MRARVIFLAMVSLAVSVLTSVAAVASPIHQPTSSSGCTVGKAVFRNPLRQATPFAVTGLSVHQHELWVGFAFDGGGKYEVLTWRRGAGATVLDKFVYHHSPTGAIAQGGTISPAGVTPNGVVVAAVEQRTSSASHWSAGGYYWKTTLAKPDGSFVRHRLQARRAWQWVNPTVVSPSGKIFGWVSIANPAHPHTPFYRVVRWSQPNAKPRVVFREPARGAMPVIDAAGDVAWEGFDGTNHVHLAGGGRASLAMPPGGAILDLSSGRSFYGQAAHGTYQWSLDTATAGDSIWYVKIAARNPGHGYPDAVDANGSVVTGMNKLFLYRRGVSPLRIPDVYTANGPVGEVIDGNRVAFTAKDRLVHFLTCR